MVLSAIPITTGSLRPEVMNIISCIRSKPWELVEVNTLAPEAGAASAAVSAECSGPTGMNYSFSSPLATYSDIFSTIVV